MKPIIDLDNFYLDRDGYVLAGACIEALKDAGAETLISRYLNELMGKAYSFDQCVRITKKYCILKNLDGNLKKQLHERPKIGRSF